MDISNIYIVTVFKKVIEDDVVKSFINLMESLQVNSTLKEDLKLYSDFIYKLYNSTIDGNFYRHLRNTIYTDNNVLALKAKNIRTIDPIYNSSIFELKLFEELLAYDYPRIRETFLRKYPVNKSTIEKLPEFNLVKKQPFDVDDIIKSYICRGWGIFVLNKAFKYTIDKEIIPVKSFKAMSFNELKNYKYQQEIILKNTKAFLEGKEANNILLYGDRGCGKSSTVKALINEFSSSYLKIIQISKESFIYLSDLYDKLRNLPNKFIIFADDISFDENDKDFSTIKAVLEGSLSEKPENTILYATTNRMHLVKESYTAREGSEIHMNDTIDESVSLSDRFGIMLTFSSLTQDEYLDIVKQIAQDLNITVDDKLYKEAEMFAAQKAIRTPRVARQFITDYMNE